MLALNLHFFLNNGKSFGADRMRTALKNFQRCENGNFMIMLAALLVPMITLIFGTIEFYERSRVHANLQSSADAAVLAAFSSQARSWRTVQTETRNFLDLNLMYRDRLNTIQTKLQRKRSGSNYILSYSVKATIKPLFGAFNPFVENNLSVKATAAVDSNSQRPPRLIPNNGSGSVSF